MNLQTPTGEEIYTGAAAAGARPDPLLTISQWADKYRSLSQRASAEPGPWRTERTPYLREIMDCLSPSSSIERTVLMAGAQIGKTECGNNWIGYVIHQAPGPMMAVQPTVEMAKRNSKQRIDPLIEESDVLRNLVSEPRSRDSGNTVLSKEFPGGVLVMTGANSAVGLRSMAARYLFLDEVDAYPGDVEGEGDPVNLALARTRTFARRKIFMVSTPKLAGHSRIETAFEESDQRRFWVPCPHCDAFQTLKFAQVKWPEGRPDAAVYQCEHCNGAIENYRKTAMLERGEWRPEAPGDGKTAGFHLSSLYSPVGWFSWGDAAEMFVNAQKSPERLQVCVNTVFGETWLQLGEAPDWKRLYDRRDQTPRDGMLPNDVLLLTAGVDIQRDRAEVQIIGWGRRRRAWLIDYRVFAGDPARPEVWQQLDSVLAESFLHPAGSGLFIRKLAIDSGFEKDHVFTWARRHRFGPVVVVKGGPAGMAAPIATPTSAEMTVYGRRLDTGIKVYLIDVSHFKSELFGRLRLDGPTGDEECPDGFFTICEVGDTAEYCKQLTAEQLITRTVKGYERREWEKIRSRNEALDTWVYARAAAVMLGIDRFQEAHWAELERSLGIHKTERPPMPAEAPNRTGTATTTNPVPRPTRQARLWQISPPDW